MKRNGWTLFLDRDGVINKRLIADYVKDWKEFQFRDGTLEALAKFKEIFDQIIVVTNQQGIGKGLMTVQQLSQIHFEMLREIEKNQGRIDKIYFCPDLTTLANNCRKPNPVMALQAKKEFPAIVFSKSFMVGDSISDMQFGKNLGMTTVLVKSNFEDTQRIEGSEELKKLVDFSVYNLMGFVSLLHNSTSHQGPEK